MIDKQKEAYAQIAQIARDNALISQAAGGVIVIIHPDTQKESGLYDHCQYLAGFGPHPSSLKKD